jgi:metal-responsive CopG/Arc/MetJ family transcriptional regulator
MKYKKMDEMIRRNISIDKRLWEKTQEYCYENGISVSEFIRRFLEEFFRQEEEEKSKK